MVNENGSPTGSTAPAAELPGLTEPFLKDLAVKLSLAGYSLEQSLHILKGHQTAGLDLLAEEQAREARKLADEVEALKALIQVAEEDVKNRRTVTSTQAELARRTVELQERRTRLETQIRQKRRQRQASAIEKEAERRAQRARNEVKARLQTQMEISTDIFKIEEDCWKINQPENERRKKLLEEELARLEADLAECRKRVEKLKNGGITKTVAGFLVWAGYLGFAATGTAISYMLVARFPGQKQDPWIALSGVSKFLGQFTKTNPLWVLLASLGFLLGLLGLFVGCIWLTDYLLRHFDRRWRTGKLPRKARKKDSSESSSPLSPIVQMLKLPEIERASFVQLLAAVPYIFAGGTLFFLLSVAGGTLNLRGQTDPAARLIPGYIGAVYALLATSVFVLYVLYVLLPRVERLAAGNAPTTIRRLLAMHWELATLLVCQVVALLAVAFLPQKSGYYGQACWGSLAVAMTLSGLGLAHGLIYRGQFVDVDRADRLRGEVKAMADSLSLGPIIELGGLYDVDTIKEKLDAAGAEADEFELVRSLHATVLSFADDPGQWSGFLGMWLDMVGGRKSKRDNKRFKDELKQLAMAAAPAVDFESAPEESEAVFRIDLELLGNQAEAKRLEQELSDAKVAEEALRQERDNLKELLRHQREAEGALTGAKASLALQQAREEMVFRAAFGVGERVATLMTLPQMPPPSAGADGDTPEPELPAN